MEKLEDTENFEELETNLPEDSEIPKKGYSTMRGVETVISIAILMATLLTLWNPRDLFKTPNLAALLRNEAVISEEPKTEAGDTSGHIALLVGHWQDNRGEVCADGLLEEDVNLNVVNRAGQSLIDMGYEVDIFPEYDLGLLNYRGAVLVAVYSGSCASSPPAPSGFSVATSLTAQNPDLVNQLAECLAESYHQYTDLPFMYEVINPDHFAYHVFRDINPDTPAVFIEMGSLSTDRSIIVGQADRTANGISSGIICFLNQIAAKE